MRIIPVIKEIPSDLKSQDASISLAAAAALGGGITARRGSCQAGHHSHSRVSTFVRLKRYLPATPVVIKPDIFNKTISRCVCGDMILTRFFLCLTLTSPQTQHCGNIRIKKKLT